MKLSRVLIDVILDRESRGKLEGCGVICYLWRARLLAGAYPSDASRDAFCHCFLERGRMTLLENRDTGKMPKLHSSEIASSSQLIRENHA